MGLHSILYSMLTEQEERHRNICYTEKEVLTEELSRVRVACGFFIVGEAFIDDLANSSVQAFQFLIL